MTSTLRAAAIRLALFSVACGIGTFALVMIFAQLRFGNDRDYNAEFANVTGLKDGQFVRIAGVEVGKIKHIHVNRDNTVRVTFTADDSVILTKGTTAAIRYENPFGDRYLELQDGSGDPKPLTAGSTIPATQTRPALDLDALIGGFRPLFRALNPEQVNTLSGQLIQVFQDQGATIDSFLAQTGALTATLADRDRLVGSVIKNLNTVLGVLADKNEQFDKSIKSLSQLIAGLANRKSAITTGIAATNAAASQVADLLTAVRPPLANTIKQGDRTGATVLADHDYLDDLLNTLPNAYRVLSRQGIYGDFFSFYLCDAILKVNGKGGQPTYIKVAGQSSGRCTPR
jgi:phospholipid/cholesterol/gamma-HCH transport system substrate-binding protein